MAKKTTTKYNSNIQEKRVAKELNADVTVASGALWGQKGDVRNEQFLVECKTTHNKFYSLNRNIWSKIEKEAVNDGIRLPIMCIDLEDGKNRIAVIKYLDFIGLDLDTKAQYLGNSIPELVENKSFRVNADFIGAPFPQELEEGQYPCYRRDVKFITPYGGIHLVMIPWEDFINILDN